MTLQGIALACTQTLTIRATSGTALFLNVGVKAAASQLQETWFERKQEWGRLTWMRVMRTHKLHSKSIAVPMIPVCVGS